MARMGFQRGIFHYVVLRAILVYRVKPPILRVCLNVDGVCANDFVVGAGILKNHLVEYISRGILALDKQGVLLLGFHGG